VSTSHVPSSDGHKEQNSDLVENVVPERKAENGRLHGAQGAEGKVDELLDSRICAF
jgi:hypothetical protein